MSYRDGAAEMVRGWKLQQDDVAITEVERLLRDADLLRVLKQGLPLLAILCVLLGVPIGVILDLVLR